MGFVIVLFFTCLIILHGISVIVNRRFLYPMYGASGIKVFETRGYKAVLLGIAEILFVLYFVISGYFGFSYTRNGPATKPRAQKELIEQYEQICSKQTCDAVMLDTLYRLKTNYDKKSWFYEEFPWLYNYQ